MIKATRRNVLTGTAALFGLGLISRPRRAGAAEPVTLKIGYIPILAAAPLFVLDAEGWAKDAGVKLELIRFEAGTAAAAGKLAAPEAVKQFAAAAGRKVKIGAQPAGSVPDTVLKHWIYKVAKLDPQLIEIVPMGIEKTQQALLAGALDPARAARLSNEYLGKGLLEPEVLELALKSPASKFVDDPRLVIEPSERLQAFQVEIGLSAAPIPVREAFDLRLFDKAAAK